MPDISTAEVQDYIAGDKVVVVTAAGTLKVIPYNLLENYINDGATRLQELDASLAEKESQGNVKLSDLTAALQVIQTESVERAARYTAINYKGDFVASAAYEANDVWKNTADGSLWIVPADYTSGATAQADIDAKAVRPHQDRDRVEQVRGLEELKLLVPAYEGQIFSLSAPGRSGTFEYLVGDYSEEVAADTDEYDYVALDSDSDASEGVLKRTVDSYVFKSYPDNKNLKTYIDGSVDRYTSYRKPRKLMSKLYANETSVSAPKIINFGDSLSSAKFHNLSSQLNRAFGADSRNGNYTGYVVSGSAGADLYASGATTLTGQYQDWITGEVSQIESGDSVPFIFGGGSPTFAGVKVYVITESGGGTANLVVEGSTVDTVDTDSITGIAILSHTQTEAKKSVAVSATGGAVKVIFAHITNDANYGIDTYQSTSFGRGGLLLSNGLEYAQARANLQTVLSDINPDFITFEMDDGFGDSDSADEAFDRFKTIIDAAAPLADKLIIGSTPRAASDEIKVRANAYLERQVYDSDASYLFFNSHKIMGTYADMIAIFGSDDGVHPNNAAQQYAASLIWSYLNLDAQIVGYSPTPINSLNKASKFASGTKFVGPRNNAVEISTDPSFGNDWDIKFPRTLRLTKTTGGEATVWQFSGNTAVFPNVEPLSLKFDSDSNTRSRGMDASSGYEFTKYVKTDNVGGMMNMQMGLIRSSFTRAQLLSMSANALIGSKAFCSDCAGGPQWVYARGNGASDWVTIDGKEPI